MRIIEKTQKPVKKFQMGGEVEQQPAGNEDPMAQILQIAAQAVQTQNCEAAIAVCQALVQIAQGAPAEEPTFARNGAKLTRVR